MMWTLVVLCTMIAAYGVQGGPRYYTTPGATTEEGTTPDGTTQESRTSHASCRYNCGRDLGDCSCASYCQYYGNCCPDIYYYCPHETTEPGTTEGPTTAAYPSCRYNCGRDFGFCSCTSSCRYYGNCCPDHYYHCPHETTEPGTTEGPTTGATTGATTAGHSSCRYNCGYHMGDCSCTSNCQYYGNCCHDHYYYCSYETTTEGPTTGTTTEGPTTGATTQGETTAGHSSCRYNCGYHMGDCSCTSNCQYYGNCCHDHYYYCSYETTTEGPTTGVTTEGPTTGATTAGHSSCRYNCGYHMGDCSCTSNCQYYGNCCHDHYYYCSYETTTEGPTTGVTTEGPTTGATTAGHSSCRYNCGYHMGDCSCTSNCQYYGNCCHDHYYYCSHEATTVGPTTGATTEGPTTGATTAGHSSCRYNCGYHMGDCSCRSNCQYYGNCCSDYYSFCEWGTTGATTQEGATTPDGTTSGATTQDSTSSYPSCRYNCGRDFGFCSCTNYCRYYGNCCPDHHYYCPHEVTTTAGTTVTTQGTSEEHVTCQNNCGHNFAVCSCADSCVYRGNCCYNYYSYCSATTEWPTHTTAASSCGNSLYGSGSFSSPNHPYYYSNNANCVWHLRTSYDQRIFLAFTFLELENCCSCDYIAVYDGSSVYSPYLGKVCSNNSESTFSSSSNYMTVVFRTDSSVVARGFKTQFTSTLPSHSGRVNCSSYGMEIVIQKSYLNSIGYDAHSLYLDDANCRPQVFGSNVVFRYALDSCGNVRKFHNGKAVYTNTVRAYTSNYGEITRQSHFKLNVACSMEKDSLSQIMYRVQGQANSSVIGSGKFNTTMRFYTSSSFYYVVTQVPYMVSLNQYIYTGIKMDVYENDRAFVLFLDTCVASPSPDDFSYRPYYLVRNGCPMDSTFRLRSSNSPFAQFQFQAFQFLRATDNVYLQCKVVICQADDYSSRCRQGCVRRKRRSLGSEHATQTVVLGPIQLKEPEGNGEETQKLDKA